MKSFCAYILPGQTQMRQLQEGQSLIVNLFDTPHKENIVIRGTEPLDFSVKDYSLEIPDSTTREEYLPGVASIIDTLKKEGGKTVISTVITGEADFDVWDFAQAYFKRSPDSFRCIFFTPQTGLWVMATPELLMECGDGGRKCSSMALAGTRKANTLEAWDQKNIHEQRMVSDFIGDILSKEGIIYDLTDTFTLVAGNVEHICSRFTWSMPENGPAAVELLDRLSPTPALAGLPRDRALEQIRQAEGHNRDCYGGYVALCEGDDFTAYVGLRCLRFASGKYEIFAGGGITPQSQPEIEWEETRLKAAPAMEIIASLKDKDS